MHGVTTKMDKLFTRWDKRNFNNFAIHSDVHRREEVSERTDTLYIRNGVL